MSGAIGANLVSGLQGLVADRVYPIRLPEPATFPAITYMQVSLTTAARSQSGLVITPRMRVNCWATSYDAAQALAVQVVSALDGRLLNTDKWVLDSDMDMLEPDTGIYRRILEFFVWRNGYG